LIFLDGSKIIIDNYETQNVIYFDKNQKMHCYDVHLVNKCNNKQFFEKDTNIIRGLGIGPNPQSPIPNPQSPIPRIFKVLVLKIFFIKFFLKF
jgi:hypothetical protein